MRRGGTGNPQTTVQMPPHATYAPPLYTAAAYRKQGIFKFDGGQATAIREKINIFVCRCGKGKLLRH